MARLILHPGKPDEQVFALKIGPNTIGRTQQNDVFVLHESLSRQHARLLVGEAQVLLEDLGSKNGTYVDGLRVDRRELRGAHYIRCGDVVFAFVPNERESARPPPAPTIVYDGRGDLTRMSLDQLLETAKRSRNQARSDERLAILLKVSELLSRPAPPEELLGRTLDLLFEILDVDRGVVVLLEDGELRPSVHKAKSGVVDDASFSRQVVSYVLEHEMAALFADAQHDPRLEGGSILAQSIHASMCAPLRGRERMLGALYVDNVARADRLGEADLAFLSAFANQAAIALDNALLSARLANEAVERSTLLRFFPPTAIDAILRAGGTLEVVETQATVLMSDISGYTALSAELPPRDLIALLNAYFPLMADIVFRHEGTLEKYIGDALLAVWGAPLPQADHAERALFAAVDMQAKLADLNRYMPRPLRIHIGLSSGSVAAGNVGSQRYLQYATIGETTSLASRICSEAGPGEILVDARTIALLEPARFDLEPRGPASLRGKADDVELWSLRWQ